MGCLKLSYYQDDLKEKFSFHGNKSMGKIVVCDFLYEKENYLGNVNVVITDRKTVDVGGGATSTFIATVVSTSDFYPFGMTMPGREDNPTGYRYGYNGMEFDTELKGNQNSYTTEFRQYDPRLGRWLSLDPLMHKFPWMSPYVAFNNNPIFFIDQFGLEGEPLNVVVLIFGQEEINKNLINSPNRIGQFDVIISSDIEGALAKLRHLQQDGQCIENLVISAHGGIVQKSIIGFYVSPDHPIDPENKFSYLDRSIGAGDIYNYLVKNGENSEHTNKQVESLLFMQQFVDENGTILYLSCNLADDNSLIDMITMLDGSVSKKHYFNGDKSLYHHINQRFDSHITKWLSGSGESILERGWFLYTEGYCRSIIDQNSNSTGRISIDVNLENDEFVNYEINIDNNIEMEDGNKKN